MLLALWTVAIAAGMMHSVLLATALAPREAMSGVSGSAVLDGASGFLV
jgi:hypothetical protein